MHFHRKQIMQTFAKVGLDALLTARIIARLLVGQQHLDWHKAMNADQPRGGRNSLDDAMAYFNRLEDISDEEWDRNRRKEADLQSTREQEIRNRAYEFYLHRGAEQVPGEQHGDCRHV